MQLTQPLKILKTDMRPESKTEFEKRDQRINSLIQGMEKVRR